MEKALPSQDFLSPNDATEVPSERSFGLTIGSCILVFVLAKAYFSGIGIIAAVSLCGMGATLFVLGLVSPNLLKIPNLLWYKLGLVMFHVVNPIILGIIFFTCITPISLALKIVRKDILSLKIEKQRKSYWIDKDPLESDSMKFQF